MDMRATPPSYLSPPRTTCASLLHDLQILWDEIGESDGNRDDILLKLEQECLEIYCRKVEETRKYRAELHQSLADAEAEINDHVSALGEQYSYSRGTGTLMEQIALVRPVLEDFRSKKEERIKEFSKINLQVVQICSEIAGAGPSDVSVDSQVKVRDLTKEKLRELKSYLGELQNEKILRLQKVNSHISTVCDISNVISVDYLKMLNEIHPSLIDLSNGQSKSISNDTLSRLTGLIQSLKQQKQQRLLKMQELGRALVDLWDLMETPIVERGRFSHVASLMSSSVDEVSAQGCLSLNIIVEAASEVESLKVLKVSKMKELVFKRQKELEEIYKGVHMEIDSGAARQDLENIIDSGDADLADLLACMDDQILKAKEQALSRKDILDRVEKWRFASEEEKWLDDYERDENRFSAGRGAHKNLKRAEKARILVSKLPSLVENLITRVKSWEIEKGIPFLYEKEPLLQSLEEYTSKRKEREEEKRRFREQKRLQDQLAAEQEAVFGSKSATKKRLGQSNNTNTMIRSPIGHRVLNPSSGLGSSMAKERRESSRAPVIPVNYVALPKDDPIKRGS